MVYAYVRELLEHLTGERPEPDADGDLPIRYRGAAFYVWVVGAVDPYVQVFSIAVEDVEASPELHAALNEVNTQLRFARTFHVRGQVLIETEIGGTDVNPANIAHACRNVAGATDAYGTALAEKHGGRAHFEQAKTAEYEAPSASTAVGPYV